MRVGLFTPDKAFEVVTKSRIVQLKAPCIKLIELVVEEVKNNFATSFQKVLLIILMGVYCPKSDVLVKYSRLCVVGYFFYFKRTKIYPRCYNKHGAILPLKMELFKQCWRFWLVESHPVSVWPCIIYVKEQYLCHYRKCTKKCDFEK